ncbi:alpha-amylase family glycosyl hydrolase [Cohnella sp. AR92]|uniref:alpha-amylase family glycosyl hydrolase n=1 Tax=Cohnella sp. AR92 TaxID=648716 RepID=UPI000F8CAFF5|nr:alpha-amylase family glycosyl hydrolase [Cohnella sp. AR92]RUS43063.1 alpha-amylase [Cohnella sp. AR92]
MKRLLSTAAGRKHSRQRWGILLSIAMILQLFGGATGIASADNESTADDAAISAASTIVATSANEDGSITFVLPDESQSVTVNGGFNDWGNDHSVSQAINANVSTGEKQIEIDGLPANQSYEYKYLINGTYFEGKNLSASTDENGTLMLPYPEFGVKGSFDGWSEHPLAADENAPGIYSFTTEALDDGAYDYKYFAKASSGDNSYYFNDPTNSLKASSGDSRIVVGDAAPLPTADEFAEQPGGTVKWVLAGTFQQGLGDSDNWKPNGTATRMKHLVGDYYAFSAVLDAGTYQFKFARDNGWDGAIGSAADGNISFTLQSTAKVNFYLNGEKGQGRIEVPDDATVTGIARYAPAISADLWPRLVGDMQEAIGDGVGVTWSPNSAKQMFVDYYFDNTVYKLQRTMPAGSYEGKVVLGNSWDPPIENFGAGDPNNSNYAFKLADRADVTFSFDQRDTPRKLKADYTIGSGKYDGKIDSSKIAFDSRSITFKKPFGAIKQGTEDLTLRIAVGHDDVQMARVELTNGDGLASTYPMRRATTVDNLDYYEVNLSHDIFDKIGIWGYKFILVDGATKVEYGDDSSSGGTGAVVSDGALPFNLTVYAPDYKTPDWMKNAVVYQIFPDRFFDGDKSNNRAKLVDGSRGVRSETGANAGKITTNPLQFYDGGVTNDPAPKQVWGSWSDVPERPDRSSAVNAPYYPNAKTDGIWNNEFYGGDIQGIEQKLDYLKQLGVTAVYLNPVAWASSNHKYDATDYKHLDPMFGEPVYNKPGDPTSGLNYDETRRKSDAVFEKFAKAAAQKGIRIINDGVFNHVGDDSIYFDRYEKYPEIGAYEYWAKVWNTKKAHPTWTKEQAEQSVIASFTSQINPTTGRNYVYPDDFGFTTWFTIDEKTALDKDSTTVTHYSYDAWWGYDSLPVMDAKTPQAGDTEALDGQHEWNNLDYRDNVIGYDLSGKSDADAGAAMQQTASQRWMWMGSSGWRLDVAPDVSSGTWQKFREAVKSVAGRTDANGKPIDEPVILGEEWGVATKYLLGDQFDSVMNYRFRDAIQSFIINGGNASANAGNAANLNAALERIREDYPKEAWQAMLNLVDSHDTVRSLTKLDNPAWEEENMKIAGDASDKALKQQALIAIFQMGYPGAPTVYYGDEVGVTGTKDPDSRRTFPWDRISGSNGDYSANGRYSGLYATYKKAASIRNNNEVFSTGDLKLAYAEGNVIAYARKNDTKGALVVINSGSSEAEIAADVTGYLPDGTKLKDLLGSSIEGTVTGGKISLTIPALTGLMMLSDGNLVSVQAPANLQAAAGNGSVSLSWDAVGGADGYRVYRSPIEGGSLTLLGDVEAPGYVDTTVTNGIKYYYSVSTVQGSGESLLGEAVSGTPSFPIASVGAPSQVPDLVIGFGTATSDINVSLSVPGLTDDGAYAGQEAPNLYVSLVVYKEGDEANALEIPMAYSQDEGANKLYKAKFAPTEPGSFHYYAKASSDNEETFSYSSETAMTALPDASDTTPPDAPALASILVESGQANLSWKASSADAVAYEVYRKTGASGSYAKIATLLSALSFTDYTVSNGTTYAYKVAAIDSAYNRAYSGEQVVTPQLVMVDVTLRLHLPSYTPATDDIYIAGLYDWSANGGKLNVPSGATDRNTVEYTFKMMAGKSIQYKYTRGTWETEAFTSHTRTAGDTEDYGNWAYSSTNTNMQLKISNQGGNKMVVDDYVLRWVDMPMIVTMPRISYGDDIAYSTADSKFTLQASVPRGVSFTINGDPIQAGAMDTLGRVYLEDIPLKSGTNKFVLHIEPTPETLSQEWYTDPGRAGQATKTLTLTITRTGKDPGQSTGGVSGGGDSVPATVEKGAVLLQAKPDSNGTAVATVNEDDLKNAAAQSTNGQVSVVVRSDDGAKKVIANVPVRPILASGSGIDRLSIDTGFATVRISAGLISGSGANPEQVTLSVSKADRSSLSAEVLAAIGDSDVYDFELLIDGKKVSKFDGRDDIAVELAYELKPGENPEQVIAYYLNEKGGLEVVKNARYDEKTGKIAFRPAHFSPYAAAYAQVAFSDMPTAKWAAGPIAALAARGAVQGVGDGRFNPNGTVTRAEFVTMLIETFDLADGSAKAAFSDVKEGAWYAEAVASARKLGIVSGRADGTFGVQDAITRQDMAVLIAKAAEVLKVKAAGSDGGAGSPAFKDQALISAYAADAVLKANQLGLMGGNGSGSFDPLANSTRAQAAAVLYRLFELAD